MSIDHEAAKATAFHYSHNTPNVTEPCVVNLALAHLDLHEQLTAERARGDALAELVRNWFSLGHRIGESPLNGLATRESHWEISETKEALDRPMEGRE